MALVPGLRYLAQTVPVFLVPSGVVYLLLSAIHLALDWQLPLWLRVIIIATARPVIFFSTRWVQPFVDRREAARRGAVMPTYINATAIGVIRRVMKAIEYGYPGEMLGIWAKEAGPVCSWKGIKNDGMLSLDPDHVKGILSTHFESFEKGPIFLDYMSSFFGQGIFNSDGEIWKFHRSITRPFLTRERITDFALYDKHSARAMELAAQRISEGHALDFQDLASRFTLDTATEFLFGLNVGSLSAGLAYAPSSKLSTASSYYSHPSNVFVRAFSEGLHRSTLRTGLGTEWPLAEFWEDKIAPLRTIMDDYVQPMIDRARARKEKRGSKGQTDSPIEGDDEEPNTLLEYLVGCTDDAKIVKDELVNLLVAGRDTTACLLTFSLYMLCEHPHVERRLRKEVFEKVGAKGTPTHEHMREMKFMRAFLNEVLRLYPPVPYNGRSANKSIVLPPTSSGFPALYIPEGTGCLYSAIVMQRRKELWGPDAWTFDPDRFLDERLHKYFTPNPFIFVPFHAGPRICLGQQFAYHEASFFLVRLLQNFRDFTISEGDNVQPPVDWALRDGYEAKEKVYVTSKLTMSIKGGFWVRMKPVV